MMNTKNLRVALEDLIEEGALRAAVLGAKADALRAEALVRETEARLLHFYEDVAAEALGALDHEEDLRGQGDAEADQLIQSMHARPAGKDIVPDSEFRTLTLDEFATAVATMRKQVGF